MSTLTAWPDTPEAIAGFYGRIRLGDDGLPADQWRHTYLTQINSPFPLRLPWERSTRLWKITCHKEVASSLHRILNNIQDYFVSLDASDKANPDDEIGKVADAFVLRTPEEAIRAHEYDLFGGCYSYRQVSGSNRLSMHAYGAAIVLGPLRTPKRPPTKHDNAVDTIFQEEGWVWLGQGEGWGALG